MSYILVVDDEKDIRDLIGQILLDEGHTVKPAHNSTSAMDYINNEEPSLIILDICLKLLISPFINSAFLLINLLCPVIKLS